MSKPQTVKAEAQRANPLRVGIGGPVGSGKTALTLALCRALRDEYQLGVETGARPHTAIREDASINLAPMVGASLEVTERDSKTMRGERPFVFTNLKTGQGLDSVIDFIRRQGLMQ